MTNEEKKQKAREYSKKHYIDNIEKKKLQMREYNYRKRLENASSKKEFIGKLINKNISQKTKIMNQNKIINMGIKYIEDKGRLKYKPKDLIKILNGEMTYK